MFLFDSHAHIDTQGYPYPHDSDGNYFPVLAVATSLVNSRQLTKLYSKQNNPHFYTFIGIHPWFVNQECMTDILELEGLIAEFPSISGIGEIGLDFNHNNHNKHNKQLQLNCFSLQLSLAKKYDLPVSIHCIKGFNEAYTLLRSHAVRGIIHSMPLRPVEAKRFADLGLKLGLNPRILQTSIIKRHDFYRQLPLSCWVVESDFPNLNIANLCAVPWLGMIALIKDLALAYRINDEAVAEQIYNTTRRLVMRPNR